MSFTFKELILLPSQHDTGVDMILGTEDILSSWFVIILALLGIVLLFISQYIEHVFYIPCSIYSVHMLYDSL